MITKTLEALKQGKMIILTDDENRENEGDLICAAEHISPEIINFMIRHGSGIVCLSLPTEKLKQLGLPLMVPQQINSSKHGTGFTISIEAKSGVTTGVSAKDRAHTIQVAMKDDARQDDLARPGHVFPLQAAKNGVLQRRGHTEGSLDLMKLAGLKAGAVICEIMNPDGSMMRGKQLKTFAEQHSLALCSIEELVNYRLTHENLIDKLVTTHLPIETFGEFTLTAFTDKLQQKEYLALYKTLPNKKQGCLVRVHSSCATGDLFQSLRCDCGKQLQYSLERISKEGGILIYLPQEGRGIGLFNKISAYALQDKGLDTVEANEKLGFIKDARDYWFAAQILKHFAMEKIKLLTNSQIKLKGLQKYFTNIKREAMPVFANPHNQRYLQTKQEKLGHLLKGV